MCFYNNFNISKRLTILNFYMKLISKYKFFNENANTPWLISSWMISDANSSSSTSSCSSNHKSFGFPFMSFNSSTYSSQNSSYLHTLLILAENFIGNLLPFVKFFSHLLFSPFYTWYQIFPLSVGLQFCCIIYAAISLWTFLLFSSTFLFPFYFRLSSIFQLQMLLFSLFSTFKAL